MLLPVKQQSTARHEIILFRAKISHIPLTCINRSHTAMLQMHEGWEDHAKSRTKAGWNHGKNGNHAKRTQLTAQKGKSTASFAVLPPQSMLLMIYLIRSQFHCRNIAASLSQFHGNFGHVCTAASASKERNEIILFLAWAKHPSPHLCKQWSYCITGYARGQGTSSKIEHRSSLKLWKQWSHTNRAMWMTQKGKSTAFFTVLPPQSMLLMIYLITSLSHDRNTSVSHAEYHGDVGHVCEDSASNGSCCSVLKRPNLDNNTTRSSVLRKAVDHAAGHMWFVFQRAIQILWTRTHYFLIYLYAVNLVFSQRKWSKRCWEKPSRRSWDRICAMRARRVFKQLRFRKGTRVQWWLGYSGSPENSLHWLIWCRLLEGGVSSQLPNFPIFCSSAVVALYWHYLYRSTRKRKQLLLLLLLRLLLHLRKTSIIKKQRLVVVVV